MPGQSDQRNRVAVNLEQPPIRVGILMSRRPVARWEQVLIHEIANSKSAEIVVWIVARALQNARYCESLVVRLGRLLEYRERHQNITHDAFERHDIADPFPGVACVDISSCRDVTTQSSLQNLDLIIGLDADDESARISAMAGLGMWRLAHGQHLAESATPPESTGLWEVLHRCPVLQSSVIVVQGSETSTMRKGTTFSSVNPRSYRRTRSEHLWKTAFLIPRLLARVYATNRELLPLAGMHEPIITVGADYRRTIPGLVFACVTYLFWLARSAAMRRVTSERWLLMVSNGEDPYNLSEYSVIEPQKDWFWADPCLVSECGRQIVFFEEASIATGKGHISAFEFDEDGGHSKPRRVLEKDYHLSYPFVFRWQDHLYMIPESAENRMMELYRCQSFPYEWVFERELMQDVSAYDATVFEHNATWWLFANIKAHEGASTWDELSLFYADNPVDGEWHPHPENPVVSDVRSARPAGRLFQSNGKIVRPSQDSSYRYGYRLRFNEIQELSKTTYRERLSHCIEPGGRWSIQGTHSFSRCGKIAVIDAMHRTPRYRQATK